ncbi:hypothetical protein AMS68_003593 [Peltaster fructicola]|uniref:NmrA-like domain-containing protein n=1 Tax=Peltaster fructicola TaxID=286661 RepID=A0A6H0XTS6_9PEZI|nr:hypothetical protein AMS68_003593 [Peltaster fructicola]
MSSTNIKNIAIVGVSGNSGSHMATALLKTGRFNLTAITRADSKSKPPKGIKAANVNYDDESSLVTALKGHEALVTTLGISAAPGTQEKLIRAAGEAGVSWIMPNEWTPDISSEDVRNDVAAFADVYRVKEYIKEVGKSS